MKRSKSKQCWLQLVTSVLVLTTWGPVDNSSLLGQERVTLKADGWPFLFSPDGKTVVATRGCSILLWDPATGRQRAELNGQGGLFGTSSSHEPA